jgi:hypothetical protein
MRQEGETLPLSSASAVVVEAFVNGRGQHT